MKDRPQALKERHLSRSRLRRFLEKQQSLEEENELLLHHLAVCPGCRATGGWLGDLFESGALAGLGFSSVEVDLATSRAGAPALWEKLRRFPFERQKGLVRDARRFRSWGLCELLCHESERLAAADAARAVEEAELAVLVSGVLEEHQPAELLWLFQLRAYAWACLGNAWRVRGDLRRAQEAFDRSDEMWNASASMGNVLDYEARLLDLKASLRIAQRRLPDALDLLEKALLIDAEEGGSLKARLLIKKSKTLEEMGDLNRAMELLYVAEPIIDFQRDSRLLLCLRHNLLDHLSKAGRFEEAAALLPVVQNLSRSEGEALDAVRLRWTESRIAAGQGETGRAISLLDEVRREFSSLAIGYDAALATLELASLYARQGCVQEVKELARQILPVFQAQDVHRESLAALAFFLQAAEREAVTADLAEGVAGFLRRARYTPGLRFEDNAQESFSGGRDDRTQGEARAASAAPL